MAKTQRVEGPEGPVTIVKPKEGLKVIIVRPGATVLGTTYFRPSLRTVSSNYADFLIEHGFATEAKILEG